MSDEDPNDGAEEGAGGKAASANLMVARVIARALWLPEFKSANPEAGPAEIKAAWLSERHIRTKPVRLALKSLTKRGFGFIAPPDTSGDISDEDA